jgi:hypothetical protein
MSERLYGVIELILMSLLMYADEGDDDYKFASVGQGNRFRMNTARRNVSFEHGGVFDMRENS